MIPALAFSWLWTNPTFLRRLLVSSLVLACAANLGCASPGVMCDMKDNYDSETEVPASGTVLLHWEPYQEGKCESHTYGCATCFYGNCTFYLKKRPPSFSDVCQLARFAHEELHGMGKEHR